MMSHRVAPSPCPKCARVLDGASGLSDSQPPAEGDVTVCLYCGAMLTFGAELALRVLSPAEFNAMPADVRGELARAALATARATGRLLILKGGPVPD